jgi:hypothetical protein
MQTLTRHKIDSYRAGVPLRRAAVCPLPVTPALPGTGGGVRFGRSGRIERLYLPPTLGQTAYDRACAFHELLHAQHSTAPQKAPKWRKRFSSQVQNAVEDVRVHCEFWPASTPRRLKRDTLCTALVDLRELLHHREQIQKNPEDWNRSLTPAVRSLAIMTQLSGGKPGLLERIYGPAAFALLQTCVTMVGRCRGKPQARYLKAAHEALALLVKPEEGEHGSALDGPDGVTGMAIIDLPRTAPCSTVSAVRQSSSGPFLRAGRLVQALLTGSPAGLFLRRQATPFNGTVLIDASGSMHCDNERLRNLCRAIPGAQVAYYSSGGDDSDSTGSLVVFARNGRRFSGAELPHQGGGNSVDLWAVRWLLRQPGPRFLVTDMNFCGGPAGAAELATAECKEAAARKALTVLPSIEAAEQKWGVK